MLYVYIAVISANRDVKYIYLSPKRLQTVCSVCIAYKLDTSIRRSHEFTTVSIRPGRISGIICR